MVVLLFFLLVLKFNYSTSFSYNTFTPGDPSLNIDGDFGQVVAGQLMLSDESVPGGAQSSYTQVFRTETVDICSGQFFTSFTYDLRDQLYLADQFGLVFNGGVNGGPPFPKVYTGRRMDAVVLEFDFWVNENDNDPYYCQVAQSYPMPDKRNHHISLFAGGILEGIDYKCLPNLLQGEATVEIIYRGNTLFVYLDGADDGIGLTGRMEIFRSRIDLTQYLSTCDIYVGFFDRTGDMTHTVGIVDWHFYEQYACFDTNGELCANQGTCSDQGGGIWGCSCNVPYDPATNCQCQASEIVLDDGTCVSSCIAPYEAIDGMCVETVTQRPSTGVLDFSRGFYHADQLQFNGNGAVLRAGKLDLIREFDAFEKQANSVFFTHKLDFCAAGGFYTRVVYSLNPPVSHPLFGHSFSFMIQNNKLGLDLLGNTGGYGGSFFDNPNTISIEFDLFRETGSLDDLPCVGGDSFATTKHSHQLQLNNGGCRHVDKARCMVNELHGDDKVLEVYAFEDNMYIYLDGELVLQSTVDLEMSLDGCSAYAGFVSSVGGAKAEVTINSWEMQLEDVSCMNYNALTESVEVCHARGNCVNSQCECNDPAMYSSEHNCAALYVLNGVEIQYVQFGDFLEVDLSGTFVHVLDSPMTFWIGNEDKPAWLNFDSSTLLLSGIPKEKNDVGLWMFNFYASDGTETAQMVVTVRVFPRKIRHYFPLYNGQAIDVVSSSNIAAGQVMRPHLSQGLDKMFFHGGYHDYVVMPPVAVNGLRYFTVAFRVFVQDIEKQLNTPFSSTANQNSNDFSCYFSKGGFWLEIYSSYVFNHDLAEHFVENRWYSIAITRGPSGCKLYIDGTLQTTNEACDQSEIAINDFVLGQEIDAFTDHVAEGFQPEQALEGYMSEFQIYERALGKNEIDLLFEKRKNQVVFPNTHDITHILRYIHLGETFTFDIEAENTFWQSRESVGSDGASLRYFVSPYSVLPPWLKFDSWKFYGTPLTENDIGTWEVVIYATNGAVSAQAPLRIRVIPRDIRVYIPFSEEAQMSDVSGNGYDVAEVFDIPIYYCSDIRQSAAYFAGTVDNYLVLRPEIIDQLNDFTLSFRFKTFEITRSRNTVFSAGTSQEGNYLAVYIREDPAVNNHWVLFADPYALGEHDVFENGVWYSMSIVRQGGIYTVFVDDYVSISDDMLSMDPTDFVDQDGLCVLGQDIDDRDVPGYGFESHQSFYGYLADMQIYERALNNQEVMNIHAVIRNPSAGTCGQGCSVCVSGLVCEECEPNLFLIDSRCVSKCGAFYEFEEDVCQKRGTCVDGECVCDEPSEFSAWSFCQCPIGEIVVDGFCVNSVCIDAFGENSRNFEDHCYTPFIPGDFTFAEAEMVCRGLSSGSHLASIHSKEENDFIVEILLNDHLEHGEIVLIGLNAIMEQEFSMAADGRWRWTDGTEYDFEYWDNLFEPGGKQQLCTVIGKSYDHGLERYASKGWRDVHCSGNYNAFVCKSPICDDGNVCDSVDNKWGNVEWTTDDHVCPRSLCFAKCNFDEFDCPWEFSKCGEYRFDDPNACNGNGACTYNPELGRGECICKSDEFVSVDCAEQDPLVDCNRWTQHIPEVSHSVEWNGNCYTEVLASMKWVDAEMFCREMVSSRSHLVSISSQMEDDFIMQEMLSNTVGDYSYWIGLHSIPVGNDPINDGSQLTGFHWTDGLEYGEFFNWRNPEEPNHLNSQMRCGTIDHFESLHWLGWGLKACTWWHQWPEMKGFICKTPVCEFSMGKRMCYDHDRNDSPWDNVQYVALDNGDAYSYCDFDTFDCPAAFQQCYGIEKEAKDVCGFRGDCFWDEISKSGACRDCGSGSLPECLLCEDFLEHSERSFDRNIGYFEDSNVCYHRNDLGNAWDWVSMEKLCRNSGDLKSGHLASFTSAEEHTFVKDNVYYPPDQTAYWSSWIGLNCAVDSTATENPDGNWMWTDGRSFSYRDPWFPGEPSSVYESCILEVAADHSDDGWHDHHCFNSLIWGYSTTPANAATCITPLCFDSCPVNPWDSVDYVTWKSFHLNVGTLSSYSMCDWENEECPARYVPTAAGGTFGDLNAQVCVGFDGFGVVAIDSETCNAHGKCLNVNGETGGYCRCDRHYYGRSCERESVRGEYGYAIENSQIDWTSAEYRCRERGGHLVSFEDEEEYDFVIELFRDEFYPSEPLRVGVWENDPNYLPRGQFNFWIGMHRLGSTPNEWKYSDGSDVTYFNWETNEPDGNPLSSFHDCTYIVFDDYSLVGGMGSYFCYNAREYFICKVPLLEEIDDDPWKNVNYVDASYMTCNFEKYSCPEELSKCHGFHFEDPQACTSNGKCRYNRLAKMPYCECRNQWHGDQCQICETNGDISTPGRYLDPLQDCHGCINNFYPDGECTECASPPNMQPDSPGGCFQCDPFCLGTCSAQGLCDLTCPNGFEGEFCETPLCNVDCPAKGTCLSPNTCICPLGYVDTVPGDAYNCNTPVCYGKTGENACNNARGQGTCVGGGDFEPPHCVCDPLFAGVECEKYNYFCGNFKADEEEVCNRGKGQCGVDGLCHSCAAGFHGDFCERYQCNLKWMDDPLVCGGHHSSPEDQTPCKYSLDNEFYCECPQNDDQGYWDPSTWCTDCLNGYSGSNCDVPSCNEPSGGVKVDGKCVCFDDDQKGHWKGSACAQCQDNYYGTECKQHCRCVYGENIPGGECAIDGSSCSCYRDRMLGWYMGSDCSQCLMDERHIIYTAGEYQCAYGFYKPPFIKVNPDIGGFPQPPFVSALYFSPDYSRLWGYFISDQPFTRLLSELFADERCTPGSYLRVFPTTEMFYESGIFGTEVIWMIEIVGMDWTNTPIGSILEGQLKSHDSVEALPIFMDMMRAEYNIHGVQFDPPQPVIRSVDYEDEISACDDSVMKFSVFATNPDGSKHSLIYRLESPDTPGTNNFPLHVLENGGIPSETSVFFLDKEKFEDGNNRVQVEVTSVLYGTKAVQTVTILKENTAGHVSFNPIGGGYYTFDVMDLDLTIGSVVLSYYLCGVLTDSADLVSENDDGLHSMRLNVVDGYPLQEQRQYSFDRIDFFSIDFPEFNIDYVIEISMNFDDKPISREIIVHPRLRNLVIVADTHQQVHLAIPVIIDLTNSFDPASSDPLMKKEIDTVIYSCKPGCQHLLDDSEGNDFKRTMSFEQTGVYVVSFEWHRNERSSSAHIVLEVKDDDSIFFIQNLQDKRFCLEGSTFEYETFVFYPILQHEVFYYFEYIEEKYVEVSIFLENAQYTMSVDYFRDEPYDYEFQSGEDGLIYKRRFASRIGVLVVTEEETVLKIHYKYFSEYLYPGDNHVVVNVTFETPTEYVSGTTDAKFHIHKKERESVEITRYVALDGGKVYRQCVCETDGHTPNCVDRGETRLYTHFDIGDKRRLVYEYETETFSLDEDVVPSHDGYTFSYGTVLEKHSIVEDITPIKPWTSMKLQTAVPFTAWCYYGGDEPITYDFDKLGSRIVPGSERLTLYSTTTGCIVTITNYDDLDFWSLDESILASSSNRRNTHQDPGGFAFYTEKLPFDAAQKTFTQKAAFMLQNMIDMELLKSSNVSAMFSEISQIYFSFVALTSLSVEIPSASGYEIQLKILIFYTRIVNKAIKAGIVVGDVEKEGEVNDQYLDILTKVENMLQYSEDNPQLKLMHRATLNRVFNVIESCGYGASMMTTQDSSVSFENVIERKKVVDKLFMMIMTKENVDEYDENVSYEASDSEVSLNFFQSQNIMEKNDLSFANRFSSDSVEGSTNVILRESKTSIAYARGFPGDFSEIIQPATKSNIVSVSTGYDEIVQKGRNLGIEFNMGEQLNGLNFFDRRSIRVRPMCYSKVGEEEWTDEKSGIECVGISDLFSADTGRVLCNYKDVPLNDADFVVRIEDYYSCVKENACPLRTLCDVNVLNNVDHSPPLTVSSLVDSTTSFQQSNLDETNDRRQTGETFFNTIKSLCINEHYGAIIDSKHKLWLWGEQEHNAYFSQDTDIPYEIPTNDWDLFVPYSLHCTETTIFVLALKTEVEGGQLWAFGRNKHHEISGQEEEVDVFTRILDGGVVDVQTSAHAVYVTLSERNVFDKTIIKSSGVNHHGSLGSMNTYWRSYGFEFVVLDDPAIPTKLIPRVVPLHSGLFLDYQVSQTENRYFYAGHYHPNTLQDENVPVELNLDMKIDFVQRLFDSCLFFISDGNIFVHGEDNCGEGRGIMAREGLLTELSDDQYGDFRKSSQVFYFTCTYTCYIIALHEGDRDVLLYSFGKSSSDVSFMATCPNGYCDSVQLAHTGVSFVVPGLGRTKSVDGSLETSYDVMWFNKPEKKSILLQDEGREDFAPEIVWSESKMEDGTLTILLKKRAFFGEVAPEIRWINPGETHNHYKDDEFHCRYPFLDLSSWDVWSAEENGYIFTYYRFSQLWETVIEDCLWLPFDNEEEYYSYKNRLLYIENSYMGRSYGQVRSRQNVYFFDVEVRFPKTVLFSTDLKIQSTTEGFFSWYITDRSFDRTSRTGSISITLQSKSPNYFVLKSEEDVSDLSMYITSVSFMELGEVTCGPSSSGDYCFQEFIVSFSVVRDGRVCEVPLTSLPILFDHHCMEEDEDQINCLELEEEDTSNLLTLDISIEKLCSGVFTESVSTAVEFGAFYDWDYNFPVDGGEVLYIDETVYFRAIAESAEVSIEDVVITEILINEIVLFDNAEVLGPGDESFLNIYDLDYYSSSDTSTAPAAAAAVGFHFDLVNSVLKMQPGEESLFTVKVKLSILYRGNTAYVESKRTVNLGELVSEKKESIQVLNNSTPNQFVFIPYVVAVLALFVVLVILFSGSILLLVTVFRGRKGFRHDHHDLEMRI